MWSMLPGTQCFYYVLFIFLIFGKDNIFSYIRICGMYYHQDHRFLDKGIFSDP